MFVTGLVLAAGGSRRLGAPKQLLPYQGGTILGATLETARNCGFDQLIVTLGGASAQVHERIDLDGLRVVENPEFGTGCSSSIVSALEVVDPRSDGIVLMLGDQPGLARASVARLIAEGRASPIAVCRYSDGIGHPFWLSRDIFGDLTRLQGDKGIWKLIESNRFPVAEIPVDGTVPLDVDTWDDYERLLDSATRSVPK